MEGVNGCRKSRLRLKRGKGISAGDGLIRITGHRIASIISFVKHVIIGSVVVLSYV